MTTTASRRTGAPIYEGSRIGESAGLILEAPHVFVEELTVKSIARIRALYEQNDLRSRLARHHGERVDPLFRAWTGVWLSPEFRSWNIEEYLPGVLAPTLILQGLDDEYGTEKQVEAIARILGVELVTVGDDHPSVPSSFRPERDGPRGAKPPVSVQI